MGNLWTSDWMHCGTLRATTDCTLLAVDAKEFQHTLGPYSSKETFGYATWFVNQLNTQSREHYTDIGEYHHDMGQYLLTLFPQYWPNLSSLYETASVGLRDRSRMLSEGRPAGSISTRPGSEESMRSSRLSRLSR